MKKWMKIAELLLVFTLPITVQAQTIVDDFTTATNWGTPLTDGGNISVGSGRMNYIASTTAEAFAGITRNTPLLPVTRDWSLQVDAHLSSLNLTTNDEDHFSDVFLGFGKTGDWINNSVFFEFGQGYWGNPGKIGYYVQEDARTNGVDVSNEIDLFETWITSSDVSLRMDYSATNHTVTYYLDANGAAGGYNWVAQGTASLVSGTYNLNLSDTDTFTVFLLGSSASNAIVAGQAYFDNLIIGIAGTAMGGDDFNDNVLDATKWGDALPLDGISTDIFLTETNAHLEFTGSAEVLRPWTASYGSYTQSWEVAMDVSLGDVALSEPDAYVNINLGVFNRKDTNLLNGVIPGDIFNVALDLYRDGGGNLNRGYELISMLNASELELADAPNHGYVTTSDRQGRLKIAFDAASKVLIASYNGNVLGWVDVDAVGSNWEMGSGDTFVIGIGGGAGAVNISAGEVSADNFTVVGGVAPLVESAKIIGLSGNLSFGSVVTGQTSTASLTITNSGNTALTVTNITYPSCFSGAWAGTVAAGASTNVTVTFAPVAVTNYSGTVTVNSDKTSGTNTISVSGTGTDDGDGNGLPDWWEQQYFSNTGVNPNALCSNRVNTVIQAYVAGLNPTNSSARFGITNHTRNLIQWNAVSGRVYNVYWTTNLMNGFQTLQPNYTGGAITDSLRSAASKCFYKIDVRMSE